MALRPPALCLVVRLAGAWRWYRRVLVAAVVPVALSIAQPVVQVSLPIALGSFAAPAHAYDCDNDGDPWDTYDPYECTNLPPPSNAPSNYPPPETCLAADPVDCSSGLFLHERTDFYVRDVIPLVVQRTHVSMDTLSRSFGIGASLSYDMFLVTDYLSYVDLILPNASRIHYNCGVTICVALGASNPTYAGSIVTPSVSKFSLRLKDGTVLVFSLYVASNTHSGGLDSITDRFGNKVSLARDGTGNLTRITSPNGRHLNFQYDSSNRYTSITDDSGRQVTYSYNTDGTLQSVTDPLNQVESYTYDPLTLNMLSVTDKRNNFMVRNVYYAGTGNTALDGRVKQQTYADGSTTNIAYTFAPDGTLTYTDVTDERGMVRRTVFDTSGHATTVFLGLGQAIQQQSTMVRDPVTHLVMQSTDALGRTTQFSYDINGNITQRVDLFGTAQATTWNYNWDLLYNVPLSITDPLNHTATFKYDSLGNLIEFDDALSNKTTHSYRPDGQLQSISRYPGIATAGTVLTTSFGYINGTAQSVTDALGRTSVFDVDALGRVTGTRDAAGQLWTTSYDALDRVTSQCDPMGRCATQHFDGNNNLTQFIKGATQRDFSYDARNRHVQEGRGATVETTLSYSPDYLHTTLTEASGRTVSTTTDVLGRTTTVQYLGSVTNPPRRTRNYAWDGANRLQSVADSTAGTISYTYDNRFDSVASESGPAGTVSYGYYANGLRSTLTPSGGSQVSYQYDAANRLIGLSQAAGTGAAQPATVQNIALNYDNANRRRQLTLANGLKLGYAYDNADQLTAMSWTTAAGLAAGDLSYTYNALGQRTSLSGSLARLLASTPVALAVGADGRLASENAVPLVHDSNGRFTQDAQYTYVWNELGLLSEIHTLGSGALRASFSYDALGRRLAKTIDGQTTRYLHDGDNPVQIQDGSGTPSVNLLAGGIDEWFARTTGGQTQTYQSDALGSVLRLSDAQGNKLVDYTYDAYGATASDALANTNGFQYTGRENDGLGLYFYRARYYKPVWGRFISQDPIGLAGGENLYAYVGGNPLQWIDPLGLDQTMCFFPNAANGFGHEGIGPTADKTEGFYPDPNSTGFDRLSGPGAVLPDSLAEMGEQKVCKTIKTSPDQDKKIADFIAQRRANPGKYSFLNRNCSHFVSDALRAGGVPTTRTGIPGVGRQHWPTN
jgi:RHS repeat-associated protein